jgi:hypothetical protein
MEDTVKSTHQHIKRTHAPSHQEGKGHLLEPEPLQPFLGPDEHLLEPPVGRQALHALL